MHASDLVPQIVVRGRHHLRQLLIQLSLMTTVRISIHLYQVFILMPIFMFCYFLTNLPLNVLHFLNIRPFLRLNTNIDAFTALSRSDERYYLVQLEDLLAESGLDCSIFTPSKSGKEAKERKALIRRLMIISFSWFIHNIPHLCRIKRKRDANLISCEVRGLGKLKVFKFDASDVISVSKGKGAANCVVPEGIDKNLCMTLGIVGNWLYHFFS